MVQPTEGMDGLRRVMRRHPFDDHVAAKDHIVNPDCDMTGRMSRQMDELKRVQAHVHGIVSEIDWDRLVDRFGETGYAENLLACLLGESGLAQEISQAASNQRQAGFVMGDGLHIQLMNTNLGVRERPQFGESAKMINVP